MLKQQGLKEEGAKNLAGHEVRYGKHRTRRSFSRIKEVLDLPNLIEIQTDSFQDFLDSGLKEVFEDVLPISNFTDTMELEFVGYEFKEPKYTLEEARIHDASYSAPIFVTFRLVNKETGEIKTQEVFFGDFPIMTEMGTFIINGGERIIVSQLVRSPGVYFNDKVDKNGKVGYGSTVIPNRGAWLELKLTQKTLPILVLTVRVRFHSQLWFVHLDSQVMMKLLIFLEKVTSFAIPLKKISTKTQAILVQMKPSKKFMSVFVQVSQKLQIALVAY